MAEEQEKQIKSKERVRTRGEVFTAAREVNAMLDLVKDETENIDATFLEPACGTGNFLDEVLRRKLAVCQKRYGKSAADYEKFPFSRVRRSMASTSWPIMWKGAADASTKHGKRRLGRRTVPSLPRRLAW